MQAASNATAPQPESAAPAGPGSAHFNLSRPGSCSSMQMLLGRDNADSRTEASRAFTESLPPSVAPSVRDASGAPGHVLSVRAC